MAGLILLLSKRYLKESERDIEKAILPFIEIDFELAYLIALTLRGVKPLSRWEKELEQKFVDLIGETGLFVRKISRTVESGRKVEEIVFSLSKGLVISYYEEFDGTPIDKSAATRRKEGLLFGYPECCTDHFIRKPYDRNHLAPEDQKILFHWACPGCKRTEDLLQKYREIHHWLKGLETGKRERMPGVSSRNAH
jgi:hypothetical protein